jgi:predicted NBD/HSP70 family sugar kinase
MLEKFIGFDIGGTKILMNVVEVDFGHRSFKILDSKKIFNPKKSEEIRKEVLDYCFKSREVFNTNKVAIASASIVESEKLNVFKTDDIYGQEKFNFNFLKEKKFQVVLENDGKAFALGAYYFDKNEDKQGLLTITLGSGLGGGFISSEGVVLRGCKGSAVEFSHIKMFFNNKWTKWEDISVARGIRREYLEKTGRKKTAQEIFSSVNRDDIAKEVIDKAQEYLGYGLANLINSFNPEKVVFGGGISEEQEYLEGAIKIAEKNVFHQEALPEWEVSKLKGEVNILGVCALYYV